MRWREQDSVISDDQSPAHACVYVQEAPPQIDHTGAQNQEQQVVGPLHVQQPAGTCTSGPQLLVSTTITPGLGIRILTSHSGTRQDSSRLQRRPLANRSREAVISMQSRVPLMGVCPPEKEQADQNLDLASIGGRALDLQACNALEAGASGATVAASNAASGPASSAAVSAAADMAAVTASGSLLPSAAAASQLPHASEAACHQVAAAAEVATPRVQQGIPGVTASTPTQAIPSPCLQLPFQHSAMARQAPGLEQPSSASRPAGVDRGSTLGSVQADADAVDLSPINITFSAASQTPGQGQPRSADGTLGTGSVAQRYQAVPGMELHRPSCPLQPYRRGTHFLTPVSGTAGGPSRRRVSEPIMAARPGSTPLVSFMFPAIQTDT